MRDNLYEMDLVLRNNITTEEHPLGVYHPHSEYHHIKKENIGLIEVMGMAILPARLKDELGGLVHIIEQSLNESADDAAATQSIQRAVSSDDKLHVHEEWLMELLQKDIGKLRNTNITDYIRQEVGIVFSHVLENAGVFKQNEDGEAAFNRFIDSL